MKIRVLLVSLFVLVSVLRAQTLDHSFFEKRHEAYFKFSVSDRVVLDYLSKVVSIDKVTGNTVYAYANESEYLKFLTLNIPLTVLPNPGDDYAKMSSDLKDLKAWDSYPTYDAYVAMMTQFQTQFPNLCKIYEVGTTAQGRKLLFAKISDNVSNNEAEPNVMYVSSIHGDETTGYVLMLRLIDYLLNNYGTDAQATNLVNNLQIWINPLHNPDGTYRGGNTSVTGATRYNSLNVDINRNFGDPADGAHPDGNTYQLETTAMMNLGAKYKYFISANFHGGVEVINYPWDTWVRLHPDDSWMLSISRAFADTVHRYSPSTYMSYLNNGVTNGYAWYRVTGGRQDYFTYFLHGREVTIELSNTKLLAAANLPAHWNYNYKSFLYYLENALYGIRGTVTSTTGQPLKAKIFISGHDVDNAEIYTDSLTGVYTRMIAPGTYNVTVSADSFASQTFNNIVVQNRTATPLNVQLQSLYAPSVTWQAGVTVADGGGSQLLTFGLAPTATNGIDLTLGEVSLPPVPPAGVFDARFELPVTPAEYSFKDFRRDTATTALWTMHFAPSTSGYPMTISWNSATLPAGTFILKDAITGTIVNVDMKTQSSVSITNTGITALVIQYTKSACSVVNLASGWNLVSAPLQASDMTVTSLFPQANSSAYAFNNGYVTANSMTMGTGYWIRHPQSGTVSICGTPATGNTVSLAAGWNLVGVYQNPVTVTGITSTPAGIINSVFYGYSNGYNQASTLQPGQGYWVRTSQAGVMNLPASAKGLEPMPAAYGKDFGKIHFADASGSSSVLYTYGSSYNGGTSFDLPPVPPAGIFDVRFAGQTKAACITDSKTVLFSGVQYPLTITADGVDMKITDVATGGKVISRKLSSGESFVIDNAAVNAVEVSGVEAPAMFSLQQNFPNPFNPVTVIRFSLAEKSNAVLSVYTQLGEKIAEIVNGTLEAGIHHASFNASGLGSGVYFYELKAGNFREVKKLIVMK